MSILLPLYIYPWSGAWEPLYWEAAKNPKLNYTVILNPCSGPCLNSLPEQAYLDEIPKLSLYPNIRRLGYVSTNYTDRVLDTVLAEIRQYSLWPTLMNDSRMSVDGIFFDETPGLYDWRKHAYLQTAADAVRADKGLGQRLVVHNPGTIPDRLWNYLDVANITVIFENTFASFITAPTFNTLKNFTNAANVSRSALSIMLHSLGNIPDDLIAWTGAEMKMMAEWNFATSNNVAGEYWHTFATMLDTFITTYAKK